MSQEESSWASEDIEDSELKEDSIQQGSIEGRHGRSCCHIATIVIMTLLLCAVTLTAAYILLQLKVTLDEKTQLQEETRQLNVQLNGSWHLSAEYKRMHLILRTNEREKTELQERKSQLEKENRWFGELFSSDNLSFLWRFCDKRTLECSPCQTGWQRLGQRCFFMSSETKTWENARRTCFAFGGDLAVVWDKEDQAFLTNMTFQYQTQQKQFHSAWIGLQDLVEEGTYLWVNGNQISSGVTYWRPLNPNNVIAYWDQETKAGQDCVAIVPPQNITEANWLNSWDDVTCRGERNFLCETKVFHLLPADIPGM